MEINFPRQLVPHSYPLRTLSPVFIIQISSFGVGSFFLNGYTYYYTYFFELYKTKTNLLMKSKTCLEYPGSFQLVPHFVATGYVVVDSLSNTQISHLGSGSLFYAFYTYLGIQILKKLTFLNKTNYLIG